VIHFFTSTFGGYFNSLITQVGKESYGIKSSAKNTQINRRLDFYVRHIQNNYKVSYELGGENLYPLSLGIERRLSMKKLTTLGLLLIMLAVLVVPVMAKTPPHGNGNGNGNNAGQENSTGTNPTNHGQGNQSNHNNQRNHDNNGNNGAKGNGNATSVRNRTPFYLQGTIKSIDTGTKIVVVTLFHGNAQVKNFIGKDLTVQATDATLIFKLTQGDEGETVGGESSPPVMSSAETTTSDEGDSNRVAIPFDQLKVGKKVAIHGNLVEGVYTARLITEYIQTTVGEPVGETP
jgi:hypothetical protein